MGAAKRGTPIKQLSDFDTKNFSSCTFDCKSMISPIQEFRNFFKTKAQQAVNNNNNNNN